MSMCFPMNMKTGFFKVEPCIVKIDCKASQMVIAYERTDEAYLLEFESIRRVIYNPHMQHELEFQTDHNTYIGTLHKEPTLRGVVDFLKVSFKDKYLEIN